MFLDFSWFPPYGVNAGTVGEANAGSLENYPMSLLLKCYESNK